MPRISIIRSGILPGAINATKDFADRFRVTNSGLLLQAEINGMNVESFKLDSLPSSADGYRRLTSNRSGCNRVGRSFRSIAWLEYSSSDKKKSYNCGYRMKNIRPVILLRMFKLSDSRVRCTPNMRVINEANKSVDELRSGQFDEL